MQSRKVEGGEQASEMPPSPLPGERTCRGLLNDLHSRHSWQVKKEAEQLRSLTRSDDPAVLGRGTGTKPDTGQSIITTVTKVKTVSFSVTGFLWATYCTRLHTWVPVTPSCRQCK